MPMNADLEETPKEDGTTIEKLHVEFTNGSLQQLRELGDFFEVKNASADPSEVVKLAISFLQNLKDRTSSRDTTLPKE